MSLVKFPAVVLLGICAAIAACSSPGRNYTDSSMQETLDIEILPNTSKMFVYRLRWPEDQAARVHVERGGFNRNRDSGGAKMDRSSEGRLHENAAFVVQRMGYCREGFFVIDSSLSRYHLWMKGECKEGATEEDKQKFGEKQTLPVKLPR